MGRAHFGMIGLGTMGRNFLLNVAEHGISGVGYDLDAAKRELLLKEGLDKPLDVGSDLADFLLKLESPRNIMLLVPAGPIVDKVIADLVPHLDNDDLIIDGGNSHFTDTERREAELSAKNIGFMGVGVSGGEEGARHGASIMPGGQRAHYDRIEKTLHAVAAKVNGEPCVAYMGASSAGHFVKMVHNGIEYAMMQLIAEAYDYMRRVLSMNIVLTQEAFVEWNNGELESYLLGITTKILGKYEPEKGPLVELILDTAGQKGTGKWTSQAAMDFGVPVPAIDAAVTMRQISAQKTLRLKIEEKFAMPANGYKVTQKAELNDVRQALHCGFILAYEQGLSLLRVASEEKSYGLNMLDVLKAWRAGAIIESMVNNKILVTAFRDPENTAVLLNDHMSEILYKQAMGLRKVVSSAALCRLPVMALSASLNYYAAFRTPRLPANLIQAQRDYFGAHAYQRIDKEGTFHTDDWDDPTLKRKE